MQRIKYKTKCACCEKEIEVKEFLSIFIMDTGLDQRPMDESQLMVVNECPYCHYCSEEIDKSIDEDIKNIVFSEKYQQLMTKDYDDVIDRKIKAAAKLAKSNGKKINLYLTSCWYLEFAGKMPEAIAMRKKAVNYMEEEIEGQPTIELVLMYLDCLRQLGEFEKCQNVIKEIGDIIYQNLEKGDFLIALFQYELMLIENGDKMPHLTNEINL